MGEELSEKWRLSAVSHPTPTLPGVSEWTAQRASGFTASSLGGSERVPRGSHNYKAVRPELDGSPGLVWPQSSGKVNGGRTRWGWRAGGGPIHRGPQVA